MKVIFFLIIPFILCTQSQGGVVHADDMRIMINAGYTAGITSIASDTKRFVSGSMDRMIKIWDAKSGKLICTLKAGAQRWRVRGGIHGIGVVRGRVFGTLWHGLFTHALIQAVQGAADGTPKDGRVTINEYLESVIPELPEKYRDRPQYPVVFSKGQDFTVVVE